MSIMMCNCWNSLRVWMVRRDFVIVVILSLIHVGLSYAHSRESGTLNPFLVELSSCVVY
jgi:hypothetical protein